MCLIIVVRVIFFKVLKAPFEIQGCAVSASLACVEVFRGLTVGTFSSGELRVTECTVLSLLYLEAHRGLACKLLLKVSKL